jgi:hypothetical protein
MATDTSRTSFPDGLKLVAIEGRDGFIQILEATFQSLESLEQRLREAPDPGAVDECALRYVVLVFDSVVVLRAPSVTWGGGVVAVQGWTRGRALERPYMRELQKVIDSAEIGGALLRKRPRDRQTGA